MKPAKSILVLFLALAGLLMAGPARAIDIEFSGRTVKREILALYDSRHEAKPHDSRIHRFAEMPLNHLGFVVVYKDVNGPLPQPWELARYRAVLTWFLEPLAKATKTIGWIDEATATGLKYVALGDIAPPAPPLAQPAIARVLARLGLTYTDEYVDVTFRSRAMTQDAALIGFERPIDKVLPDFPVLHAQAGKARVHLAIETRSKAGDVASLSAVVVTGPGGGFAAQGFTTYFEASTDRVLWTLNPFAFFRLALGDERFPIPDTTTASGRRIYFSHIDGDGWNNLSEIERYRDAQVLSSEVVLKELIEPYPDLPVTVGVIGGDADPALGAPRAARRIARDLFALPQVEVATHTYTHPYNWQFFEAYNRSQEVTKIDQFQRPEQPLRERITGRLIRLAGKEPPPSPYFDKYVAGSDDLPRTYLKRPFDIGLEIDGAIRLAESLAPTGKRAKVYLWSGDTTPFEGAIRATRTAGVRNINGGDSRLDREYPSVAYVPPISRVAGNERQIYSGNSNENTYTNDWTGPYYGFFMLGETLRNTENPRRLKPFNVYYHMYSGEKTAALAAVKTFLDMARKSPVIPLPASEYAAIADDFFGVEIQQVDLFSWAVAKRGANQTVRFDDAAELVVDLAASLGVIGSNRHAGSLYVTLDPKMEVAKVTLRSRAADAAEQAPRPTIGLIESRWRMSGQQRSDCTVALTAQGFGAGEMVWQTRGMRALRLKAERGGKTLHEEIKGADPAGKVTFRLDIPAAEPLDLRLECHD